MNTLTTIKLTKHEQIIRKSIWHILKVDVVRQMLEWHHVKNSRITTRGNKDTIKYLKSLFTVAQRFALGQPFQPIPFTKSSQDGFPSAISSFRKLLEGTVQEKRAALTVLYQYKLLYTNPDRSVETIASPSNWCESYTKMETSWKSFIKNKFLRMEIQPPQRAEPRFSTKAGPNGPHALLKAHQDALAVTRNPEVLKNIELLVKGVTPDDTFIIEDLKILSKLGEVCENNSDFIDSRIHFLAEGGGKTRVIAICDHWSQQALYPIHLFLMNILKRMTTDGSFSHNRVALLSKEATALKRNIFCFDLTSATDRFPVKLQEDVLSVLLGPDIASAWTRLLIDRDFRYPTDQKGVQETVRYSVGQPMGMLSSWAAFALAHHAIIQYSAFNVGFYPFRDYVVIGDDVAIFEEAVANEYERILASLDIPINRAKSLISKGEPSSAEIAKRLFLNGEEVSPIPPDIFSAVAEDHRILPQLILVMSERGWFPDLGTPGRVDYFNEVIFPYLRDVWPIRATDLAYVLTFPCQNSQPFAGVGELWKWCDKENLLLITKRLLLKHLSEDVLRYEKLCYESNIRDLLTKWGDLPIHKADGIDLNGHPFVLALGMARMQVMNLTMDVHNCMTLDEMASLIEIGYVPDPLAPSYRTKMRERELKKVGRILEIRDFLNKGLPEYLLTGLNAANG